MKYRVTITHNSGKRSVYKLEDFDVNDFMYQLNHCYYKSFSVSIDS